MFNNFSKRHKDKEEKDFHNNNLRMKKKKILHIPYL